MPNDKQNTQFTRAECQRVREEVTAKVRDVARQFGLEVEFANGRFTVDEFTLPFTFRISGAAQEALIEKERAEFEMFAEVVGLKPEHYGREVDLPDGLYRIVGLKPEAPKNNVIIEKVRTRTGQKAMTSKRFICPHTEILDALGEETVAGGGDDLID
jgi:hypothetical protein